MDSHISGQFSEVDTTQRYPVGLEAVEEAGYANAYGARTWIYVKNGGAAAFAAGNPVIHTAEKREYDDVIQSAAALTPASRVVGVAQHAIAVDSFGWVGRYGRFQVLPDATNIAADLPIIVSNAVAGSVEIMTVADDDDPYQVIGKSIAALTASTLGYAHIDCRG